jgi:nicotinamide-nucleotide amidase
MSTINPLSEKTMQAIVLSIGDELVSGQTVNTNATWLSAQLSQLGITTAAHVTVGDDLPAITHAIQRAAAETDLLLISGGLGPTDDDLTRQALAAALGDKLIVDEAALAALTAWFAKIQRPMSGSNHAQAMRPPSATCLPNAHGTAPGLKATLGKAQIYVVPGVPREMKGMWRDAIAPAIKTAAGDQVVRIAKLSTFGMGESLVGEKIKDLMVRGANPAVGTTVHDGIVSVRIYARGSAAQTEAMVAQTIARVTERLSPVIFGQDDETIEGAVAKLLLARGLSVTTAESCTGGLVAQLLTATPGSSAYFSAGWVTYANDAKEQFIGVPHELLEKHGAVSAPVASAMAEGARQRAKSDLAVALTGIAGPSGGTAEKPVGLVYIALAHAQGTIARGIVFPGERDQIRLRAAQMALSIIRWFLTDENLDKIFPPEVLNGPTR